MSNIITLKRDIRIFPGIWQGLRSVFPGKMISGCAYHWAQAVCSKTQNLCLQPSYMAHDGVYNYLRKLYAVPFLPSEHFADAFTKLEDKTSNDALRFQCHYIRKTWIDN